MISQCFLCKEDVYEYLLDDVCANCKECYEYSSPQDYDKDL